MEIITMRNHSLLTRLNVTLEDFPCRHHFQADNKQPYSHVVKLPDGRFGVIRFLRIQQFPEVYHAHEISKAAISAPARRSGGKHNI
jgi:hypothetical protein